MSFETVLFLHSGGGEVVRLPFERPVEVAEDGEIRAATEMSCGTNVLLARLDDAEIAGARTACAAVLVPPGRNGRVRLNGIALPPGMHMLGHRDRLDAGDRTFWVSLQARVEETVYQPSEFGSDCFCFRTKARLVPGESIVICPGSPGEPCGAIYRSAAWKAVDRCRRGGCGFDPSEPPWRPVPPRHTSGVFLDELLERLSD